MVLEPYSDDELRAILKRAIGNKERGLGALSLKVNDDALDHIIWAADGDARTALNNLEAAASLVTGSTDGSITITTVEEALQKKDPSI